jgi:hypothetical protein
MADNNLKVTFSADTGDFSKGVQTVRDDLASIREPLDQLSSVFGGVGGMVGGLFAGLGLDKIIGGFKDAADSAAKFDINIEKMSSSIGEPLADTAALAGELKISGVSTDDYTGALMRLERQVRTNEPTVRSLGVATRDSNGQLISGDALMKNTLAALEGYKAGTDRAMASQVAFGRGAQGVADLLLINAKAADLAKQDMAGARRDDRRYRRQCRA